MNRKWNSKMKQDLLKVTSYTIKCINIIDDSNYYDIMKSIERKVRRLRDPR